MATTLAAQAVGSTVALTVDGENRNFLVVHQGNPDPSVYDASCDGAWLLMQDVYSERIFGSANDYAASTLHTWLNGTFLSKLDSGIQQAVQTAGLPCFDGEAVRSGVKRAHIIDGRIAHSILIELLTDEGIGTMLVPEGADVR